MSKISPLHHIHQATGAQFVEHSNWLIPQISASSATAAVTIVDRSWDSKLQVEGAEAAAVIKRALGEVPMQNGEVVHGGNAVIIGRITPLRFLLLAAPDAELSNMRQLTEALGDEHVTVTDQSDGQGGMRIAGDGAISLLQTLCALDFDTAYFPINTVKISSFAKVRATIWHLADGYHVYVGRSFTEYVWGVVHQAQRNIGR